MTATSTRVLVLFRKIAWVSQIVIWAMLVVFAILTLQNFALISAGILLPAGFIGFNAWMLAQRIPDWTADDVKKWARLRWSSTVSLVVGLVGVVLDATIL